MIRLFNRHVIKKHSNSMREGVSDTIVIILRTSYEDEDVHHILD